MTQACARTGRELATLSFAGRCPANEATPVRAWAASLGWSHRSGRGDGGPERAGNALEVAQPQFPRAGKERPAWRESKSVADAPLRTRPRLELLDPREVGAEGGRASPSGQPCSFVACCSDGSDPQLLPSPD